MPQVKDVRRPHADIFVGIAVIAFCAVVYAATYALDDVAAVISQGMGPEAFPRLVLAVMALFGALLVWQSRAREPAAPEPVPVMVIYTTLLLLGFMLATALVGMLAAIFLLVVAMGRLWGERRLLPLCATAAMLCLAVWGVFVRGFGVPLPGGLAMQLLS
jgi:putative tricarboxylic transport membrane protein